MRVGNTQPDRTAPPLENGAVETQHDKSARSRDVFVKKPKPKRRAKGHQETGVGFMKAFTMANLAFAGGLGALPQARASSYAAPGSCPPGMHLQGIHSVEIPLNIGGNWAYGPCEAPEFLQQFSNPPYTNMALAACRSNAAENGARVGLLGFCDNVVFKKCGQAVNVWLGYMATQWFCERD